MVGRRGRCIEGRDRRVWGGGRAGIVGLLCCRALGEGEEEGGLVGVREQERRDGGSMGRIVGGERWR